MSDKQQIHSIRAALYLRVSTEDQKKMYGLDVQKEAVEAVVKAKGQLESGEPAMVLAGEEYVYVDDGVSGALPMKDRPAFLRMKEDIENAPEKSKPFDIVIVYRIDRLARKLQVLLDIIDFLQKYTIKFISANENIDTSTPFGRAMLGIIGVIAELERETMGERMSSGRIRATKLGVYMGPGAPFGYKKDEKKHLKIFKKEARVVEKIFRLFVTEKKTTQEIAGCLTDEKILTPLPSAIYYRKREGENNKKNDPCFWRASTVRDRLKDKIYLGKYYYHKSANNKRIPEEKWKLSPHIHEPIIDISTFDSAQKRIKEEIISRNSKKAVGNHIYLLSGLLKCQGCHNPYSGRDPINWTGTNKKLDGKKRSYYYQCGGKNTTKYSNVCKVIPFPAKEIEQFVTDFVKSLLNDPINAYNYLTSLKSTQMREEHLKREQFELIEKSNDLPSHREAIKHQHKTGHMDDSEFDEEMKKIDKLEIKLKKKLATVEFKLANKAVSDRYSQTFKLFAKSYKKFLKGSMSDRQELSDLIHLVVDKINVYSRKVTKKDKIAGKKTEGQLIPHQVRIDLRLPQEMMLRFAEQGKFEVKNAVL